MKSIIIILASLLVYRVNAGTYTHVYTRGNLKRTYNSSLPEGQTINFFEFDDIFCLTTKTNGSSLVQFEVTTKSTGFVAFGFTPKSISDIVIGGVNDSNNQTYYFDMHSPENSNDLILDTKLESDWVLTSSSQDLPNNITKLTFDRLLKTTDPNANQDLELKDEDVHILWYLGASDDIKAEFTHQGSSLLYNLLRDELNNAAPTASASIFIIFIAIFILLF